VSAAARGPLSTLPESEQAVPWRTAGALALAVAACYANSLDVPFLFDDPAPGVALAYDRRPLVAATFALNRAWSGWATWSYHLVNVLVHVACALLLLGVLRRAMAAAVPALAAATRARLASASALLWALHPLQTNAVTYLSQRAESLAVLLYLAHLYAFLRATTSARPARWQGLALLALALALGTKELTATAPVAAFLFDLAFVQRREATLAGLGAALRARPVYHAAVALVTLALGLVFVMPVFTGDVTMGLALQGVGALEYLRTQPGVVLHYLRLVIWPSPLILDHGWPIARTPAAWVPQSLVVLALLGASLVLYRRRAWAGYLGLFFFLVLAPTSSVVPIQDAAFEHRMYLPLVAPLVLLVAGARCAARRLAPGASWLPAALAGAAALAAGLLTVRRNQDYRDPVRLYAQAVAHAPHHARAHLHLGTELLDAGRLDEAIAALEEGLRLEPGSVYGHLNLGKAYLQRGDLARALPRLELAAELEDDPRVQDTLGGALLLAGDAPRALAALERALAANPGFAPTHWRRAEALMALGRREEARAGYARALELDPSFAPAHLALATLLLADGRAAEALMHADAAAALAPGAPDGPFARAQALRSLGRFEEALAALRATIERAPQLPEPHAELAQTVARFAGASGADRDDALSHARRAVELGGARPELLLIQAEAEAGVGQLSAAVATLERALALPDSTPLAATLRARRDEYAARAPR